MTIKINGVLYNADKNCKISDFIKVHTKLKMPCGGHGKCGKCKVQAFGNINILTDAEKENLTQHEIKNGIRLACMLTAYGDCEIIYQQPDGKDSIVADGFMPSFEKKTDFSNYGIAVDIGTTTVAARLYDANGNILSQKSCLNSQMTWGADVISRIEAQIAGNGKNLAEAVCDDINNLILQMIQDAQIDKRDIEKTVITGNTAMLHLLTKTSAEPLSRAPFKAKRLFDETVDADELNITSLQKDAEIYLPPCMSAFVGADITTAILASDMCKSKETALLVDVGTNGEIALWHNNKLTVCSTAAGPAFEGVGISMGMSGKTGAIDRVAVVNGRMEAHVIDGVLPDGICGSGIIDAVACLLDLELLDETGVLEDDPVYIAPSVCISQHDIRAVQLAKSAVCAGILTLVEMAGITCADIKTVYVAGGFGSHININSAVKIGLFPKAFLNKVKVIGNGALTGASMLLLNNNYRETCRKMAFLAQTAELATNPLFAENYVEKMMF